MLNRVFGQLESGLHGAMRNMVMPVTPEALAAFAPMLHSFSDNLPRFLAVMLKRHGRARLLEITQEPRKEQLQSDAGPRMFASESEMLRALIAQLEPEDSDMWREVGRWRALSRNDVEDELNDVRLAREELDALGG